MIEPRQLADYDAASRNVDVAASSLRSINTANMNHEDRERLAALISQAETLRALLYRKAHNCFLRERGYEVAE